MHNGGWSYTNKIPVHTLTNALYKIIGMFFFKNNHIMKMEETRYKSRYKKPINPQILVN